MGRGTGSNQPSRCHVTDWNAHLETAQRRIAEVEGKISVQKEAMQRLSEQGADTGIDGKVFFKPDGKRTEVAIVSVKSGGVAP